MGFLSRHRLPFRVTRGATAPPGPIREDPYAEALEVRLRQILSAESVLAPATAAYQYVLSRDATDLWLEAGRRMGAGDFGCLVETLVELNRDVMWKRDEASPWVQVTNGKLDVHFADERAKLPTAVQLATYQVSPHFLGALRAIALELGEELPWAGAR